MKGSKEGYYSGELPVYYNTKNEFFGENMRISFSYFKKKPRKDADVTSPSYLCFCFLIRINLSLIFHQKLVLYQRKLLIKFDYRLYATNRSYPQVLDKDGAGRYEKNLVIVGK